MVSDFYRQNFWAAVLGYPPRGRRHAAQQHPSRVLESVFLLDLPLGAPAAAQVAGSPPAGQGANPNACAPTFRVVRNLPYVQPADPARTGDLYLPMPSGAAARPAVVVIHGGTWVGGNNRAADTVFLSRILAQHGYVAFNITYRLMNRGGSFPHDVQDVKDAIAFLAAQDCRWDVDVHRIEVTGTSAGGHLSLMAGYTPNRGIFAAPHYPSSQVRIAAVGDFFGSTDLAVLQSSGPFAQSQELAGLLKQRGGPAQLVAVPGGGHGPLLGRPGPQRTYEVNKLLAFLRTAFRCGTACQ